MSHFFKNRMLNAASLRYKEGEQTISQYFEQQVQLKAT